MARALALLIFFALLLPAPPAGAMAAGSLTVAPATGGAGTVFVVVGSGFAGRGPVRLIVLHLIPIANGGRGEQHVLDRVVPVAADGSLTLRVDSTDFAPDEYRVLDEANPSQIVGHFTVTGDPSPYPGLPNTGGGGGQSARGRLAVPWLVGALPLVVGAALLRMRRRHR